VIMLAHSRRRMVWLFAFVSIFGLSSMKADDGMWTFDNPPSKQLKAKYGFEPTQEWLDHVRLSSVRFMDGGSGAFVSPDGLVLTNHHVARGQLQKMSSREKDYVAEGFFARAMKDEVKCADLELNVLVSMENVTARVQAALKGDLTPKQKLDTRKAVFAQITKEAKEKTGLRADIVTLYQGGEYWLYNYKKYTDVRLVMAPEMGIAFYGGDPDNFTFPRHDIDMTFFRVYENDKPIKSPNYLHWNTKGAADGELVFVSGHPGSTDRLVTYDQLIHQRDHSIPEGLKSYQRRVELLREYSKRGPEQARQAAGQIFGIENSIKVRKGEYKGLLDKDLLAKKAAEDKDLRDRVSADPVLKEKYAWAWDSLAAVVGRQQSTPYSKQAQRTLRSRLYTFAMQLVQATEELKKPNGERQSAYQDANLDGMKFRLFSPAPVYLELDEMQLADGLQESLEKLGADDSFNTLVLNGKSPAEVAHELIKGSTLADPSVRKRLFDGGEGALAASTDPMVVLARKLSPQAREAREWTEKNIMSITASASEKIGEARFAVYGKNTYPDATFTLRLSYGSVKGYPMNGTIAASKTTFYGLFDRAFSFDNKGDFKPPQRYLDNISKLDLKTPLDFVSTCDIIGGNSGSPVLNAKGEYVGLIFDGNIESLPGRFLYTEEANRAVAVHSAAIIEVLRKLYDAGSLADELEKNAK
jgi:hypothetical protein